MNELKKTIYTLSVNDKRPGEPFDPEMEALTLPLMERYAEKIGASLYVIRDRKFPEMPPVYEKFQIFELGAKHGNDWNIFVDADTLINPDCPDFTVFLTKDVTASFGSDLSPMRWRPDKYFLRDGRFIGKGNWCAIASDWCLDYWHPLEEGEDFREIVRRIYPIIPEAATVITPDHLIDDYLVSRNIARYGLKHTLIPNILLPYGPAARMYDINLQDTGPFYHKYTIRPEQKIEEMKNQLKLWGVKV